MTITYNGQTYMVSPDSVYYDFSIGAASLEDACEIIQNFSKSMPYTFGAEEYPEMVIVKRIISIEGDDISVKVKLRIKTETELVKEELEALRQAMSDLAETTSKTTTAKINKMLEGVK